MSSSFVELRIDDKKFILHENDIFSTSSLSTLTATSPSSPFSPSASFSSPFPSPRSPKTNLSVGITIKQFLGICMKLNDDFALSLSVHQLLGISHDSTIYLLTQSLPMVDGPKIFTLVYDEKSVSTKKNTNVSSQTIDEMSLSFDKLCQEMEKLSMTITNFRLAKRRSRKQMKLKYDPNRFEYHRAMSRTISQIEKVDLVFQSCSSGNVEDLLCYLELYGNEIIEYKNSTSFTPLHHACFSGQYEICHVLLDHGADITLPAKLGMTCLHLATTAGHPSIIKLLLEYGADPFVKDMMGNTVLDRAKMGNHQEIIELIRNMVAVGGESESGGGGGGDKE